MRLRANRNIRHNGKRYKRGDVFDCDDKLLVAIGAAEVVTEVANKTDSGGAGDGGDGGDGSTAVATPASEENLGEPSFDAEAVKVKLSEWMADDPEFKDETKWNKSGTPSNNALDKALGFNVTAAQLKPIWKELKTEAEQAD